MCGIVAVLMANKEAMAVADLYEALNLLQHRGQDAAGIVTSKGGHLFQCKDKGLVRDVFTFDRTSRLIGNMGIGHGCRAGPMLLSLMHADAPPVRYPTAGTASNAESQPFYVNSPYGISLAHNGNLTNSDELRRFLDITAHRHINTGSDSEVLLNILAYELASIPKPRIDHEDIFNAVTQVHSRCRGGYAVVAMVPGYGIVAFRDVHGIRPLILGQRETDHGTDYIFASESVVLDVLGYTVMGDVAPGECVIVRTKKHAAGESQPVTGKNLIRRQCAVGTKSFAPCIFEYVYFARPDSVMDGISVYKSRLAMGEALARKIAQDEELLKEIDVIIPVPDTSRVAALQASVVLQKTYREGFIKNRYVGRTFIMPGQAERVKSVRRKLNVMPLEFQDKNVLIVDDSIVRGTTSAEIIRMAREAGANKVFFASCAPEIRYCNVYGIDMPTRTELVAYNRSVPEIARTIGADRVIYLSLKDLVGSVLSCAAPDCAVSRFDTSVFDGVYVTEDIDEEYLSNLERSRSDSEKMKRNGSFPEIENLFNHR